MSTLHRLSGLLGRGLLLLSAAISLHWAWRISVGLGQWEGHFKHPIAGGLLFRYLSSPLVPLVLVASALFLLALGRQQRGFRRAVGGFTLAALCLALLTPDGFAHDMGHCMIDDCSEEVGVIHLVRCGCIVAVGFLGLALTEFGCKCGELGASPNGGPAKPLGDSGVCAGPPSVS